MSKSSPTSNLEIFYLNFLQSTKTLNEKNNILARLFTNDERITISILETFFKLTQTQTAFNYDEETSIANPFDFFVNNFNPVKHYDLFAYQGLLDYPHITEVFNILLSENKENEYKGIKLNLENSHSNSQDNIKKQNKHPIK